MQGVKPSGAVKLGPAKPSLNFLRHEPIQDIFDTGNPYLSFKSLKHLPKPQKYIPNIKINFKLHQMIQKQLTASKIFPIHLQRFNRMPN